MEIKRYFSKNSTFGDITVITVHVVTVPDDNDFLNYFTEHHIELAAAPRVGEYLSLNDPNGIGQSFEVLAVIHPVNPGSSTATVEVRLRHIGTEVDLFKAINRGKKP